MEAQNHAKAWELVLEKSGNQTPVGEQDILAIHSLMLDGIKSDEAGRYRKVQTYIGESVAVLPRAQDVPQRMNELSAWLEAQPFTPATAFHAHLQLVAIHPFIDGNGRTARLLTNTILMKGGYLPVIVQPEDRLTYYEALESYHDTGSTVEFAKYMSESLEKIYDWVGKSVGITPPHRPAIVTQLPLRRRSLR